MTAIPKAVPKPRRIRIMGAMQQVVAVNPPRTPAKRNCFLLVSFFILINKFPAGKGDSKSDNCY